MSDKWTLENFDGYVGDVMFEGQPIFIIKAHPPGHIVNTSELIVRLLNEHHTRVNQPRLTHQLHIAGKPFSAARASWIEAAEDAVAAGEATWEIPRVHLKWEDKSDGSIERL